LERAKSSPHTEGSVKSGALLPITGIPPGASVPTGAVEVGARGGAAVAVEMGNSVAVGDSAVPLSDGPQLDIAPAHIAMMINEMRILLGFT